MTAFYFFRHYRRSGEPFWGALFKAIRAARRSPLTTTERTNP